MQELKLYDPARQPASWTEIVRPGQYAVFHTDVHGDVEKRADGSIVRAPEESTCLLFDSLEEAETYCRSKVEKVLDLRCDVYDHTGKSKPPMLTYVNAAHEKDFRKYRYWGWGLVVGSVPFFGLAWYWNGSSVLSLIVGFNLLSGGLRMVHWGYAGRANSQLTIGK
jgi:hypothetical protein